MNISLILKRTVTYYRRPLYSKGFGSLIEALPSSFHSVPASMRKNQTPITLPLPNPIYFHSNSLLNSIYYRRSGPHSLSRIAPSSIIHPKIMEALIRQLIRTEGRVSR